MISERFVEDGDGTHPHAWHADNRWFSHAEINLVRSEVQESKIWRAANDFLSTHLFATSSSTLHHIMQCTS